MLSYPMRIGDWVRAAEGDLERELRELRRAHRRLRQSIPAYVIRGSALSLLTAPIIYSLLLPLCLLDIWVTGYQWICFPVYGIARVRRGRYFVVDRHRLAYLNAIEKLHCTFCSYANGLIAYVGEVAARTEQYWCPIRHAQRLRAPHERYRLFLDYGDAHGYRRELPDLRRALRPRADINSAAHRPHRRRRIRTF